MSSAWLGPSCQGERSARLRSRISWSTCLVTAWLLLSCGDECPRAESGGFRLEICGDPTPEAEPRLGGACAFDPVRPTACGRAGGVWQCDVASTQAGVCTIDTQVNGELVRFELVLVHKLYGPCEDEAALPLECCEGDAVQVGPCDAGTAGGLP